MTLYSATSNPGKLAEFADAAQPSGITVLALPGLNAIPEPEENAATFQGNADIKAIAYSLAAPGLLVFADDSGLEVPALGNLPGVRSARFAQDHHPHDPSHQTLPHSSRDQRNNAYLLQQMADLPSSASRAARFVCCLSMARNGEILLRSQGSVSGELLHAPRGSDGFGYDPLFYIPSLKRTFAELPRQVKWQISHRGIAFRSLLEQCHSAWHLLRRTP
ncbi:MAG: non-canonical purine NTP pyrophosphatase [Acidobacteriaceae bacterium]